jgi:hypothetical protein
MAKSKGLNPLTKFEINDFIEKKGTELCYKSVDESIEEAYVKEIRAVIDGSEYIIRIERQYILSDILQAVRNYTFHKN